MQTYYNIFKHFQAYYVRTLFALVNEITLLSRGLLYPFIIYYTYIFYNRVFSIIVHHFNGKKTQRLRKLSPTSRIFASNYSFLKNISILYPYLAKINGFFFFFNFTVNASWRKTFSLSNSSLTLPLKYNARCTTDNSYAHN